MRRVKLIALHYVLRCDHSMVVIAGTVYLKTNEHAMHDFCKSKEKKTPLQKGKPPSKSAILHIYVVFLRTRN